MLATVLRKAVVLSPHSVDTIYTTSTSHKPSNQRQFAVNTIATECTTPFSNRFVHTCFHAALCECMDSPVGPPAYASAHSIYPYRVQPRLCSLQKQTPTYMQKMTQQWQDREIDN